MPLVPQQISGTAILRMRRRIAGVEDYFVLVNNETTVGRHPSNRICIPRRTVSRFHGRIIRDGARYQVEDLKSSNGTFVNGKRVKQQVLRNADKIIFGDLEFSFYQDEETSGNITRPDTSVRLATSPQPDTKDEVLHVQAVQDAENALSSIDSIESIPKATRFLRAHYHLLDIARQRPSQERLLDSFLELVVEMVKADRGVIVMCEGGHKPMQTAAVHFRSPEEDDESVVISQTILDRCISEQVAILSRDASQDARFAKSDSLIALKVRSAICTPLVIRGSVLGVCYLDVRGGFQVFTDSDLAFVTNLSSQLVLALDNLRMTRERLQAEQLALIGRTMSEVSHSLKNILSVTQSGAEVLDKHLQGGRIDQARKTWTLVRHGMDRMHSLARAMLEYSRSEVKQRAEVQVNDIVQDVYNDLRPDTEKTGIRLELQLEPGLKTCWIQPAGLYDAVMNLAVNSRDALSEVSNGVIAIKSRAVSGMRVQVSVSDNGHGIPPELRERIFQPFFTTKGAHGNGMGLAMVEKFTREMGGAVEIDSTIGQGTEIRLLFAALSLEEDEEDDEPNQPPCEPTISAGGPSYPGGEPSSPANPAEKGS